MCLKQVPHRLTTHVMLTLIRSSKSKTADEIEKRLKDMVAAYEVVNKEISNIPYLIESGIVMQGDAITNFLNKYTSELKEKQSVPSDAREIG